LHGIKVGALTGSGIVATIDLWDSNGAATTRWVDKVVLSGGASYINRFALGVFYKGSNTTGPDGPIGSTGNSGKGYELTADSNDAKLTAKL
jgi:hypothetical protein